MHPTAYIWSVSVIASCCSKKRPAQPAQRDIVELCCDITSTCVCTLQLFYDNICGSAPFLLMCVHINDVWKINRFLMINTNFALPPKKLFGTGCSKIIIALSVFHVSFYNADF